MSCFNPNYMECFVDEYTGLISYQFKGNARYSDPTTFGRFSDLSESGRYKFLIPCRHCLGCHIDYSRTWANRLCIELNDVKKGVFVTLTYNNEHLPLTPDGVPTLEIRDTQLFMKRLRKKFSDYRIRFFLVGEYGTKNNRPHYHAILFGLDLSDFDLRIYKYNELKQPVYTSSLLERLWSNGFVSIAEVNYRTCAYVSRYILKKHYSFGLADLHGAKQEFVVSSRRPGIGFLNYNKYLNSGVDNISINTGDDVHTFPLPKSLLKKGLSDENCVDFCQNLIYDRRDRSNERVCSDLYFSELSYDEFLKRNFKELYNRIKLLKERS